MAYDKALANRLRLILSGTGGILEKQMFGGIGYILNGNMACGVIGSDLIVRVGAEGQAEALLHPHARPFDYSGRPMKGWVYVAPEGCRSEEELRAWVQRGVDYAGSLPPK
jgi:TfoX/Sxy family transcriptional regulator of competence genes